MHHRTEARNAAPCLAENGFSAILLCVSLMISDAMITSVTLWVTLHFLLKKDA